MSARVTFTDSSGDSIVVEAESGESVMEASRRHRLPGIRAECGGFMLCATCHVYVDAQDLASFPAPSPEEDEMLDGVVAERLPTSRLACQLKIHDGAQLRVALPVRQT